MWGVGPVELWASISTNIIFSWNSHSSLLCLSSISLIFSSIFICFSSNSRIEHLVSITLWFSHIVNQSRYCSYHSVFFMCPLSFFCLQLKLKNGLEHLLFSLLQLFLLYHKDFVINTLIISLRVMINWCLLLKCSRVAGLWPSTLSSASKNFHFFQLPVPDLPCLSLTFQYSTLNFLIISLHCSALLSQPDSLSSYASFSRITLLLLHPSSSAWVVSSPHEKISLKTLASVSCSCH